MVAAPVEPPPLVEVPPVPDEVVPPVELLLGIAECRKVMNFVEKSQANQTLTVELVAPDRIEAKPPVSGMEQFIDSYRPGDTE